MNIAWVFLSYAGCHIFGHFFLYVIVFRHTSFLSNERGILLFHVSSASLLGIIALAALLEYPVTSMASASIGAIFAHGIYSLTFLELWTLSQISFSQEILNRAASVGLDSTAIDELEEIGEQKRIDRLASLKSSGLIKLSEERWTLTLFGKLIAICLRLIQSIPSMESPG